jgi:hypothetical protein
MLPTQVFAVPQPDEGNDGVWEHYEMDFPTFQYTYFPIARVEQTGRCTFRCKETGLNAVIHFLPSNMFYSKPYRVKGVISAASKVICTFDGHIDTGTSPAHVCNR